VFNLAGIDVDEQISAGMGGAELDIRSDYRAYEFTGIFDDGVDYRLFVRFVGFFRLLPFFSETEIASERRTCDGSPSPVGHFTTERENAKHGCIILTEKNFFDYIARPSFSAI
jgi:hypothetical protein